MPPDDMQEISLELTLEQRRQAMDRVTWWGVGVNILLAISKLVAGFIAQSHALIADGFHSFSDLISDGMVLLASKHAAQEADEDHPYGHARYETLATIGVGLFLIAVGVGIGFDAADRLLEPQLLAVPGTLALWIAVASIVGNELLFQYTIRVAEQIKSNLLRANAWHHRTDSISSVVVFIGIGGAMLGWPILDDIAAVIVAIMIAKIGWDLSHQSVQELVDTGLDTETIDAIKDNIMNIDGVEQLHMLRTRRMGNNALVDVHVLVDSKLSVSEGHQISEAVAYTLKRNFEEINDVTVHIDPEDDELTPNSCRNLPLRSEVEQALREAWSAIPEIDQAQTIILHYLDGEITADLQLPMRVLGGLADAEALNLRIRDAASSVEHVNRVNIFYF